MNALLRRQEKTSSIELTDDAVCKKIKFTKSDIYIIAGRDFSVKQFVYSLKGAVLPGCQLAIRHLSVL